MRFEVLLLVPVDCVVTILTMLDTNNVFGLFVVILTTMFFSVAKPCSVSYTCWCNSVSPRIGVRMCEPLSGGQRTYINCSTMCVIPNNAFQALPCKKCLEELHLVYYNISDIQPNAFTGMSNLQALYLNNNEIQELHLNTFQQFYNLANLDVTFNRLRYIHPEAFLHLKSFFYLNVSHNALVLNGTILYSDYINVLDAAFCNPAKDASWYVLKRPLFSGLPNLTKLVLEGNAIECLMWDTFSDNKRLQNLDLKNNMLKFISHQITLGSPVIELDLSNNPLDCNRYVNIYAASCTNNRVKIDELSCWTSSELEQISCDDVPPTGPPYTETCDSDIVSTYPLPTSVGISQDNTTSAVFSTTSETAMSSLYSDQHSPTSAFDTSNEIEVLMQSDPDKPSPNSALDASKEYGRLLQSDPVKHSPTSTLDASSGIESLVEFLSTSTTEGPKPRSQNSRVAFTKASVTNASMWIVFGVVLVIIVVIVVGSVVVILRVYKQQDLGGSVSATEYFNFRFDNNNPEMNNKVDETYRHFPYISVNSLEKHIRPKKDLHYSSRDVTTLHEECDQGQPETGSSCCSAILEKSIATGRKNVDLEENVYEEII